MGPLIIVNENCKVTKLATLNRVVGRVPVKLVFSILRVVNVFVLENEEGIGPVSLGLLSNVRLVSLVHDPI